MASFDTLVDDSQRAPQGGASGSFDSMVDDEDKYGGVGGAAKAFGAAAARTATFGLSDQALVHSGAVEPETLKGLQETNPVSSVVGDIAGIAAPLAVGDVAGLANLPGTVAKLGGLTEGAASAAGLGGTAAKALGYGAEGAAYGLGQGVSENALGDHDLVSEKTLANIGLSAAFMGGIGGLVGKFGKAAVDASSAEDKFLAQKMESIAQPGSDEAVLSQTGLSAEDKLSFLKNFKSQKVGAGAMRQEFQEAGLPEVLGMMSDNQTVQKYASAISQLPTMAGDAVRRDIAQGFEKVNSIVKDAFNIGPAELMDREQGGRYVKDLIRDKFDQMMEPLKVLYKAREELGAGIDIAYEKSYKVYEDLIEQSQKFRNVTNEGREVIAKSANDFLKEASEGGGMANLDAYSKNLGAKARQAMISGDHDVAAAYRQVRDVVDKFVDDHLAALGKQVEKEGIEGASAEAQNAIKEYKNLRAEYARFKNIFTDFAKTTGLGKKATTEMGLNEALDKIADEKFVDRIFDPKNAQGLRDIQKNFPEMFSALTAQKKSQMYQNALVNKNFNPMNLMKGINNEQTLSKGVKELLFTPEQLKQMSTADKWMKNLPDKVGPSGTPEGLEYFEMAKNPIKSLIGHTVNEVGSATGKKLIESLIKPEEEMQLKTLINLNKAQEKIDKSIGSKIKDILNKGAKPITAKAISKITSLTDFNEKSEQIRENASNPTKTMDKIYSQTEGIFNHAPNVSNGMQVAFVKGMQFLNSKLPEEQVDFFGKKAPMSMAQVSKFDRYYKIVEEPLLALDQVKTGTLVPETIETLTNVYPRLYQEMSAKLIEELHGVKDIPYQTLQSISQFTGAPLSQNLMPQNVMNNQMVFAQAAQAQMQKNQAQSSSKMKVDKASRLGLHSNDDSNV